MPCSSASPSRTSATGCESSAAKPRTAPPPAPDRPEVDGSAFRRDRTVVDFVTGEASRIREGDPGGRKG